MGLCPKPRDLARLRQDSLGPAEADQVIGFAESRPPKSALELRPRMALPSALVSVSLSHTQGTGAEMMSVGRTYLDS